MTHQLDHDPQAREALRKAIAGGEARIAIIGLGYVGLPLAIRCAKAKFPVIGVEKQGRIIDALNRRISHVPGVADVDVSEMLNSQKLVVLQVNAEDYERLTDQGVQQKIADCDVFIVCVPTPLKYEGRPAPDCVHLERAMTIIGQSCRLQSGRERLVVVESTTYPGCTRELTASMSGEHRARIHVAYSPERIDPGSNRVTEPHKVIGVDPGSDSELITLLYSKLFPTGLKTVSSSAAAETVKCAENGLRFVSISFANELAWRAAEFGIDVWSILRAVRERDWADWLRCTLQENHAPQERTDGDRATTGTGRRAIKETADLLAHRLLDLRGLPDSAELSAAALEDAFADLCVSYFAELRSFCKSAGESLDCAEIVETILTKGYGLNLGHPGPGVGGHCIPVDPLYLYWKARKFKVELSLIADATAINDATPDRIVGLVRAALHAHGKCIRGAKILALGVTYKENVPDLRESRSLAIMEDLHTKGADLYYCDPVYAARAKILHPGEDKSSERQIYVEKRSRPDQSLPESKESNRFYLDEIPVDASAEAIAGLNLDCAVILTAHSDFAESGLYRRVLADDRIVIVDSRNAIDSTGVANLPNVTVWGRSAVRRP